MITFVCRLALMMGLTTLVVACSTPQNTKESTVPRSTVSSNIRVENGVSLALMQARKARISDLHYQIVVSVPDDSAQPLSASVTSQFTLSDTDAAMMLDFKGRADQIASFTINGTKAPIAVENQHIMLPTPLIRKGRNSITLTLIMGEAALNRHPDFLYSLFVPDRARSAFPLFDQPNLKARYKLALIMPQHWTALAGGEMMHSNINEGRKTVVFKETRPVSSYLFSFVAGDFKTITRTVNGRSMTLMHRENDTAKVARNLDAIFNLHFEALNWLEDYTQIDYPFQKFAFALLPGFPFGGMEHPGAIQYRDSSLFLSENPTQTSRLSRARLISHEVAHMWFGNLVTMDWFNDVWTKEVFANFMAAKIINPAFPDVNHDLNFLLSHYPAAYDVDRTIGANPIRQKLDNLAEAGSLYGAIIYQKAPIMMRQLELALGEEKFKRGIRTYLARYQGGNATWPQLIDIFDQLTDQDMKKWSKVWVTTAGRPHYKRKITGKGLRQSDPRGMGRVWLQKIDDGLGYGLFPATLKQLTTDNSSDVKRGAAFVNLNEQMLAGNKQVNPQALFQALIPVYEAEDNPLLMGRMRLKLVDLFWSYLTPQQRDKAAPMLESLFWQQMQGRTGAQKRANFKAYQSIATTDKAKARLKAIWANPDLIEGVTLSENDKISLAGALALYYPDQAEVILTQERERINNPDRLKRFDFIRPSLSADAAIRDAFFEQLKKLENRHTENWVLASLRNLHHPLRRVHAMRYIAPSLQLMSEIKATGSIFFPQRFISATLDSYSITEATEASEIVEHFMASKPDYNPQLRMKILQAADLLYRKRALAVTRK